MEFLRVSAILSAIVALIVVGLSALDIPTVFLDGVTRQPVACITPETMKEVDIADSRCQVALAQRHDVQMSAPGWRP